MKSFFRVLFPALEIQFASMLGFGLTLLVSYFYLFQADPRFPQEEPWIIWVGFGLSALAFLLGHFGGRALGLDRKITLSQGAWIVLLSWTIACSISALVFVLAGFPVPEKIEHLGFIRRFMDGLFESMSGFTTTGTSILPSVEAFSRSILFWRALTHWIGGMGLAYLAMTLWKHFTVNRSHVINAESETPNLVLFKQEEDAQAAGRDFLKIYILLTLILVLLLCLSGAWFRLNPYEAWYDNVYDAITTAFATMGTGGFMAYNASIGLPVLNAEGVEVMGGLQNPTSEWIIAFFMLFASLNFTLWYVLFFQGKPQVMFKNKEFQTHIGFVLLITLGIWLLLNHGIYSHSIWENLRYAFFNVTNIISTTGFINDDFTQWPVAAQAVLFICYLVGASVGSTGGGLKFTRFIVLFKHGWIQMKNLIHGRNESTTFILDGVEYDEQKAGLITINIVVYYLLFLLGGVLILMTSSKVFFTDGSVRQLDFVSGFTAAIANLGNIGPSIVNGEVGDGPTGNYSAFTTSAKFIMYILMFIGRVGVLTFLMIIMTERGQEAIEKTRPSVSFDADEPLILK